MKTIRINKEQAEIILDALKEVERDSGEFYHTFDHTTLGYFHPCREGMGFVDNICEILTHENNDYDDLIIPPPPYVDIVINGETLGFIMWLGCTLAYIYQVIEPPKFVGKSFCWEFHSSEKSMKFFSDDPAWYFPLDVLIDGCRKVLFTPPTVKKINAMIDKYGKTY